MSTDIIYIMAYIILLVSNILLSIRIRKQYTYFLNNKKSMEAEIAFYKSRSLTESTLLSNFLEQCSICKRDFEYELANKKEEKLKIDHISNKKGRLLMLEVDDGNKSPQDGGIRTD